MYLGELIRLTRSDLGLFISDKKTVFSYGDTSETRVSTSIELILVKMLKRKPYCYSNLNIKVEGVDVRQLFAYPHANGFYILANGQFDKSTERVIELVLTNGGNRDRLIADHIGEAVIESDGQGIIVWCNQATCTIFGYQQEQLVGQNVTILMPEPHRSRHVSYMQQSTTREDGEAQVNSRNLTAVCHEGRQIPIRLKVIRDTNRVIAIINDLTDTVKGREIERLGNAKRNFIASISHELRTPLNGIIGMTGLMLQESNLPATVSEAIEIIHECGDQLLTLVNQILDFSKISSGQLRLNRVHFDLKECIEKCLLCFSRASKDKNIPLLLKYPDNLSRFIYGDQNRIKQVLFNLLSNAIKFTNSGSIKVSVSKRRCSELSIQVSDTGIGIPVNRQTEIFEAFHQLDTDASEERVGTGLGLAISRNLATLMNGGITVSSEPGVGSCFDFTFQTAEIGDLGIDDVAANDRLLKQLSEAHIMVVDDQHNNRRVMERMLTPFCRNLTILSSSREVLEIINTKQFDIIFLDIIMPGINGLELISRIRGCSNAKMIAISSITDVYDFLDRFDQVIVKPVTPQQIMSAIKQCLTQDASEQSTETDSVEKSIGNDNLSQDSVTLSNTDSASSELRILVVEDNGNNRTVIRLLLDRLGYRNVTCVSDGCAAVREALAHSYDVILMDLKLPVMDGVTASREILRQKPDSYIIIVSACIMDEDRQRCQNSGINNFLAKPIDIKLLSHALAQVSQP